MALISKQQIEELVNFHNTDCISIFIPTHRYGKDVSEGKDALLLKNQVRELKEKLKKKGKHVREIDQLLAPVEELISDGPFWSYQSDGLAIFLADNYFQKYTVPIHFEAFHYLSNEFYIKPLMPILIDDERFFVLTLKLDEVSLYEGSNYSMQDVIIEDLAPSRLEEVVGYDFEQRTLQFRGKPVQKGSMSFHGHGEGKNEHKNEILRYFRAVNDGLMKMLHDELPPMVVACLDHHFAIYKEVNTYTNLFPKPIAKNPSDLDVIELHGMARELLHPYFDKRRQERMAKFSQFNETGRTSSSISEIIPAALEGKIEVLFVENKADVFGVYNPNKSEVTTEEEHHTGNVSLLNLAATQVYLHGGQIYLLEKEEMPWNHSKVHALYRY